MVTSAKSLLRALLACTIFIFTTAVFAGGFQLVEVDSASTGDFHSGAAADTSNVAASAFNAAILAAIPHKELSVGAVFIPASSTFNGTVTSPFGGPANPTPPGGFISESENFVPNLHFVLPLDHGFAYGFGTYTFYGLSTRYPVAPANIAQAATLSTLKSVDVDNSLAYLITKNISIGAGFDFVYAVADYNNMIPGANPLEFDNDVTGQGVGYHLGVLIMFTPKTRLGISYRSPVILHLSGTSKLKGGSGPLPPATRAYADFPLPSMTIVSIFHQVTNRFSVMATAIYTGWSIFSKLILNNTVLNPNGSIVVNENYHDSWTFAAGAHFKLNDKYTLKFGGGWDETPTRTGNRDIRLPDANRIYLAAGVHVNLSKKVSADLGYVHVFFMRARVNNSQQGGTIPLELGTAASVADVIAGQLTFKFV